MKPVFSTTKRHLLASVLAAVAVWTIGTVGYRVLGDYQYSWLDCLYMTFITVTTIGYTEAVDVTSYEYE
ncbi:MAG: ion channel [Gallionella sp.]|nr:ion channel [Gallionella sp.]MDD4947459.1 ion channel [Gallionella sp.]